MQVEQARAYRLGISIKRPDGTMHSVVSDDILRPGTRMVLGENGRVGDVSVDERNHTHVTVHGEGITLTNPNPNQLIVETPNPIPQATVTTVLDEDERDLRIVSDGGREIYTFERVE